jgi:hypothetical protein
MFKWDPTSRDKALKSVAAAGEGGTSSANQVPDEENASKKAAKKAEKAAKKAAHKSGAPPAAAAGTQDAKAAGEKAAADVGKAPAKKAVPEMALNPSGSSFGAMEVALSPDAPLTHCPLLTLTVAALLNVAPDLTLKSDHSLLNPALGMKVGRDIVGDAAMARYLFSSSELPEERITNR